MKHYNIFILFFMTAIHQIYAQSVDVKMFGAKGDGLTDDTEAIIRAIHHSLEKEHAEVFFPIGIYRVLKPVDIYFYDKKLTITGEDQTNTIIRNENLQSVFSFRGQYDIASKGELIMENLSIEGNFPDYSKNHPFIYTNTFFYGIKVSDLNKVRISNVNISNIYGMGIFVHLTKYSEEELNARFDLAEINSCTISNVWGLNPENDDYGDGIYVAGVKEARIFDNMIFNDFHITNQFGRAGIVVEYLSTDIAIKNNTIFGYDRAIHIEDDFGGHIIDNNTLYGSDLGIVFYNRQTKIEKPVQILNNYVSNRGLPKKNTYIRTRGAENNSDRSLLTFYVYEDARKNSVIKNNLFEVDGTYDYYSTSLVNLYVEDLFCENNVYMIKNERGLKKVVHYNDYSQNSMNQNDTFINISGINISKNNLNRNTFEELNLLQNSKLLK